MIRYPASLSLTAYSYFFATIFMVLTGVLVTDGLHEWALTKTEIIAVLYAVSISCALLRRLHHLHGNDAKIWNLTWLSNQISCLYLQGIVASCLSYSIMTWANKILGPSLVALYNPLQPAFSAILSTIFLGDPVYLGRFDSNTAISNLPKCAVQTSLCYFKILACMIFLLLHDTLSNDPIIEQYRQVTFLENFWH